LPDPGPSLAEPELRPYSADETISSPRTTAWLRHSPRVATRDRGDPIGSSIPPALAVGAETMIASASDTAATRRWTFTTCLPVRVFGTGFLAEPHYRE